MGLVLVGVPYDASSSYRRGAAGGPAAFRAAWERARAYSNLVTESGLDLGRAGVWEDGGDLPCGEPAPTREVIEGAIGTALAQGQRPLLLGGDHSITYPALRAAQASHGPVDVLHLDAHPDLYPDFEGDRFSHACPFARALEDGLIGRLVQVGLRAITPPQGAVAERYGVEQIALANWAGAGAATFFFERPLWISLDLDVLDPAFAPGVSHPEPGGLSVREVIATLQRVHGRAVGADLVEYNPAADHHGVTGAVAVKLAKELAARLLGQ